MIIIDGRQSDMQVSNFSNLEEILVQVMKEDDVEGRVLTDVLVNDEVFSEIYPHQAEDVDCESIQKIEVRTVPVGEMAVNISEEMYKVVQIMIRGSEEIAKLFRQADDTEGLELLQDLLDVTRDFMGMVEALRSQFNIEKSKEIADSSAKLSSLLSEMAEVLENEDWILFADLLEYEFLPTCENWKQIIVKLREDIRSSVEK